MKVAYKVNDNCTIETEVKDMRQGFVFIAYAQTVFGIKKCGNCGSEHLTLAHKTPGGYEYYSVVCQDCHHEFKFGQVKESGRLFPKGWEPPYDGGGKGERSSGGQEAEYQYGPEGYEDDGYDDDGYEEERPQRSSRNERSSGRNGKPSGRRPAPARETADNIPF